MSAIVHERPGVYSSYDASSVVQRFGGGKVVGLAALSGKGESGQVVTITSLEAGLTAFGSDGETKGMEAMLRLLFANGAGVVKAVRAADADHYGDAFDALSLEEDVQVVTCDSGELPVQQLLRVSLEEASAARRERIGVVGSAAETAAQLIQRAGALNSERMVLVGGDVLSEDGSRLPGMLAAAALAGVIAASGDPAAPINGAVLRGLGGTAERYGDSDIDLLVRGGVTPIEGVGGAVSAVRGITTRTRTGGTADSTWRELSTILIVDDVIPTVRAALRSRFARKKNTAQTRGAIRSQVIVELESKLVAEIIDGYGDVSVSVDAADPSVCVVEFSFAVAHGLNQIYLTAHITV
ncbi:MAG: phage tail sheath protein [Oscillospiraceae bacterium]|nr:phage tail sheath protein [Oscillospiraceae bacterium]